MQPAIFASSVLTVAPRLLDAQVSVHSGDGVVTLRLTEVEAYQGAGDPASHAFGGRNRRNASMFAEPGTIYVYRHLGVHDCANLVCQPAGDPAAVLLRAGTIVAGLELAAHRRGIELPIRQPARAAAIAKLASGPARLAQCLGWTLADDGERIEVVNGGPGAGSARSTIRFVQGASDDAPAAQASDRLAASADRIRCGPRVGVRGLGADPDRFGWRFYLADAASVSAGGPARGGRSVPSDPTAQG